MFLCKQSRYCHSGGNTAILDFSTRRLSLYDLSRCGRSKPVRFRSWISSDESITDTHEDFLSDGHGKIVFLDPFFCPHQKKNPLQPDWAIEFWQGFMLYLSGINHNDTIVSEEGVKNINPTFSPQEWWLHCLEQKRSWVFPSVLVWE